MASTDVSVNETKNDELEYVPINAEEELGLSNFAQYTLLSQNDDNSILTTSAVNDQNDQEWHDLSSAEVSEKCDDPLLFLTNTQLSMLQELDRLIKMERGTPPSCQGEGDGPNNCLSTPTEKFYHNEESVIKNEVEQFLKQSDEIQTNENDPNQMNYTTLEPARMIQTCVNFETPQLGCQYKLIPSDESSPVPQWHNTVLSDERVSFNSGMQQSELIKMPMTPYVVRAPVYRSFGNGDTSSSLSFHSSSSSFLSSRSHESDISSDFPKPPTNTPNSEKEEDGYPSRIPGKRYLSASQLNCKLAQLTQYTSLDDRETHNAKERERRGRIRDACQVMRKLLPGNNDRTDNATIFEQFTNFIAFLKDNIDVQIDKDYLKERHLWKERCTVLLPMEE